MACRQPFLSARKVFRASAGLALAGWLCGCAESLPTAQLPDLVKDPRKFLTKEEQQKAISDLSQKKAAQQAEIERREEKPK